MKSFIIIFVAEPPPPPKNLKYTKILQNRIDISWEKPAVYEFFEIVGYIISYKEQSQSKYKTQNMTSATLSVILSDLRTDTFYDITVHGYNKEARGEKMEIKVKTKKGKYTVPYSVDSFNPTISGIEIAYKLLLYQNCATHESCKLR